MTTIYTGLDIAKLNLQLHLAGQVHDLPNTAAGHRRLLKLLATRFGVHVVCEATGGYERDVIAALHEAKDEFSVEVATAWEKALAGAQTPCTRKVAMRAAMVLGIDKNSVYPALRRLVHLGLGGKNG